MKTSRVIRISFLLAAAFVAGACATASDTALEKAQFALDKCSTTNIVQCNTAITEAAKITSAHPEYIDALLIKSSAEATIGGFDILLLISELTENDGTNKKFKTMHSAVVGSIGAEGLDDIRESIDTLDDWTANVPASRTDYFFQLGTLQEIEAFSRPSLLAQPTEDSPVDVDEIQTTDMPFILADFKNADNNIILGGITEGETGYELVTLVRKYYCAMHNISSDPDGFTLEELRDMVSCQLIDGFAGPFQSTITACSDFDFAACENAGDTN